MTDPKQPSPKEALKAAVDLVTDCVPDDLVEKPKYLRQFKAAIPVAELHEQIVRWVFDPPECDEGKFWSEMHRIRHELEALKAKEE